MTVETALVLPLFCVFLLHMGSLIEMIRLHGNLETALWETGRKLALYGAMTMDEDTGDYRIPAVALSYTYVKADLLEQLGKEYLDNAPLEKGSDGLQFLESHGDGDTFEIVVTYAVEPYLRLPGVRGFRMANRYYGHLWNGYQIPEEVERKEYVYVTENESVYHTNRECTHLRLSVEAVVGLEAERRHNVAGGRYRACEKCVSTAEGVLPTAEYFITKEGTCYHSRRDCPGLKRTVRRIPYVEAEVYVECTRCRQQRESENTK